MKAFLFQVTAVERDEDGDVVGGDLEVGDMNVVIDDNQEEAYKTLITSIWGQNKPEGHKYEMVRECPLEKGVIIL